MNDRGRTIAQAAKIATGLTAVALLSGCGTVKHIANGVRNPVSPEESRAQVVDAATEVVNVLNLPVTQASFTHASCNDQGDPPFRGHVAISYPHAANFEASDAAEADMVRVLRGHGWTADPGALSHGTVLTKNGVDVTFYPQNAATPYNGVDLSGECRDVTTTKAQAGDGEDLDLR